MPKRVTEVPTCYARQRLAILAISASGVLPPARPPESTQTSTSWGQHPPTHEYGTRSARRQPTRPVLGFHRTLHRCGRLLSLERWSSDGPHLVHSHWSWQNRRAKAAKISNSCFWTSVRSLKCSAINCSISTF